MSLEQEVEFIRNVPILSDLAKSAQKMLCFTSERITFEPGQVVFRQGDFADSAYVVIEGSVEISVSTTRGSRPINTVNQHGIIGEAGILGDMPRSASATAMTRLETLRIIKDVFRKVIYGNPDAALRLTSILAQRLANTTMQLSAAMC